MIHPDILPPKNDNFSSRSHVRYLVLKHIFNASRWFTNKNVPWHGATFLQGTPVRSHQHESLRTRGKVKNGQKNEAMTMATNFPSFSNETGFCEWFFSWWLVSDFWGTRWRVVSFTFCFWKNPRVRSIQVCFCLNHLDISYLWTKIPQEYTAWFWRFRWTFHISVGVFSPPSVGVEDLSQQTTCQPTRWKRVKPQQLHGLGKEDKLQALGWPV